MGSIVWVKMSMCPSLKEQGTSSQRSLEWFCQQAAWWVWCLQESRSTVEINPLLEYYSHQIKSDLKKLISHQYGKTYLLLTSSHIDDDLCQWIWKRPSIFQCCIIIGKVWSLAIIIVEVSYKSSFDLDHRTCQTPRSEPKHCKLEFSDTIPALTCSEYHLLSGGDELDDRIIHTAQVQCNDQRE